MMTQTPVAEKSNHRQSRCVLLDFGFMTTLKRIVGAVTVSSATLFALGCGSKAKTEDEVAYPRSANYKYADLIVKDYDEMHAAVQGLIKKAQAEQDENAIEPLRNALKLIFTRPDSDNMVAKLTTDVRRELAGYGAFDRVIAQLAAEATDNLRNKENTVSVRTSASFILENLLAEIRPESERENGDMRKTVQRIADARLSLPPEVKTERKLRGMFLTTNPSDEAQKIIDGIDARDKAAKKAAEKRKKK